MNETEIVNSEYIFPYYQKYNVIQSNIDYEHIYHCTPIYL